MGAPMANGDGRQKAYEQAQPPMLHFGSHAIPWVRLSLMVGGTALAVVSTVIGLLAGIGVFNAPVMKPEINEVKIQVGILQSSVGKIVTKLEEVAATMNRIDGFISGQVATIGSVPAPPAPATAAPAAPAQASAAPIRRRPAPPKKTGWSLFN